MSDHSFNTDRIATGIIDALCRADADALDDEPNAGAIQAAFDQRFEIRRRLKAYDRLREYLGELVTHTLELGCTCTPDQRARRGHVAECSGLGYTQKARRYLRRLENREAADVRA